jgi:hypothetical protein
MRGRGEELSNLLELWSSRRASLEEVRALAAEIGNQHWARATPVLIELLSHEDAIVRYNAINSLSFELNERLAEQKVLNILGSDQDEDCRRVSAGALGYLFQNTRNREVLTALANAAMSDSDDDVRGAAYKALLIVSGVSREEHLELLRKEVVNVDPERVRSIVGKLR